MTRWDFRALPGHPSFIQAEAGIPKSHQHFPGPTRQGPEPLRSGCWLWKQVLAPVGSVLTVLDLAPEMNLERKRVLLQNSLPHPHPGPQIQVGLWTGAPRLVGHHPKNRQLRRQSRPAGRREGREEEEGVWKQAPLPAQ